MKNANDIRYVEGNQDYLNVVKPLWEKLNSYHKDKSIHFKDRFESLNYEKRIVGLHKKAKEGKVVVLLAYDEDEAIGYCISTIDHKSLGEVESLYVEEKYRGRNIGDYFMKKSLHWMEQHGVKDIRIGVAAGNEVAFSFYERYGFYPKTTILSKK